MFCRFIIIFFPCVSEIISVGVWTRTLRLYVCLHRGWPFYRDCRSLHKHAVTTLPLSSTKLKNLDELIGVPLHLHIKHLVVKSAPKGRFMIDSPAFRIMAHKF